MKDSLLQPPIPIVHFSTNSIEWAKLQTLWSLFFKYQSETQPLFFEQI